MKNIFLKFSIFLLGYGISNAQVPGCTDPQSANYNPAATINDGSCSYNPTNLVLTNMASLSAPLLNESSGLTFLNGKLWTFNDSGNANDIYRIDTSSGTVFQTVDISNATNIDWEDMASGNDHLFVGDFGNNNGDRQNLKIYRINKSDLTTTATSVNAAVINFSYSDQTSFPTLPTNHNFDCEAMIFMNDSIHLFSKNWVDLQTKHYVIPNVPGTHVAQYRETHNTGFLVTGASVQSFGVIALIGYLKTGTRPVSMCMIYDYKNNLLFNGNKRKFDLSTQLVYGQVEGVEFFNSSTAFVTNELFTSGTTTVTARLRTFNIAPFLPASYLIPDPVADFSANNVNVCASAVVAFTNQSTNNSVSWQWYFPGGTPSASNLQHPQVQYNTPGTYAVTLIAINGAGTDTIIKNNYVTVNALPPSGITASGAITFCSGGSVTLNAGTGTGITYQWKKDGVNETGATGSAYVASTTGSYSCSLTNSCGSIVSNSINVVVTTTPATPGVVSGPAIVCKNTANNLFSILPVGGGSAYTWSVPAGAAISSGQGSTGINIHFSGTAVNGNVCVIASNSCGSSTLKCKTIKVVKFVPSKPTSIAGNTVHCPGANGVVFSCPVVSNASSYTWTVPATVSIVSGQGTNSITLHFLTAFTSGSIKVAAVNCLGSSAFRSLAVISKPAAPGTISGTVNGICAGTMNAIYSVNTVNGATGYTWIAPVNATIAGGQGTNSVAVNFNSTFTSGTLKVAASNGCGSGNARNLIIRSVPVKPASITGAAAVCANQIGVTYEIAPVAGATGYHWVVPAGSAVVAGQQSTAIAVNYGASGGNVKVRAANGCGNGTYRILPVSVTCREKEINSGIDVAHIYPNPSRAHFTLELYSENDKDRELLISDITGRKMEVIKIPSSHTSCEFGNYLSSGIYLAEYYDGKKRRHFRLVKQ